MMLQAQRLGGSRALLVLNVRNGPFLEVTPDSPKEHRFPSPFPLERILKDWSMLSLRFRTGTTWVLRCFGGLTGPTTTRMIQIWAQCMTLTAISSTALLVKLEATQLAH